MEDNIKSISTDLFYKVRSRFSGLKLGTETGEVTINPEEAVFFDFDYMEGQTPIGHVSISLAETGNMKVYYSTGIAENMDPVQKDTWYGFLRGLREFAKRRLMSFDTRDITKDNLDQRDFGFLSQYANNTPVGEGYMKESMYGTAKTSYQKLENTRLIIKHDQQVDETSPGARTRHINAMFIENSQGERFKYPFIHLAGARAMQRHVQEGGMPYDDIGKHIIGISEKIAHLKNFGNYVVRNDLMNSETNEIVGRAQETLDSLRETIKKLAKKSHYEQFKAEFQAENLSEVPQEFIEDLTNKFTVKNFKEDIKSVFPIIYSLMQANEEIHYDDIVAMTQSTNEDVEIDLETADEFVDPFSKFEAWAMNLGEDNAITSQDEEEKAAAVEALQNLVGEHFPAGLDGQNAISSLKGIIDDPRLAQEIKATAKEDADTCVRPLVHQWLESNAPDVLDELDFGDMEMESNSDEEQENVHQANEQQLNIKEVAEFMFSCYDKDSRTFPRGPEGVVTMVGKKFGEQAEQVARKMVERMAPQQNTQVPQVNELAQETDQGMGEEAPFGAYYYEKLAQEVFDQNPNLDTSGKADEVLNAAWPLMVRDLGKKSAYSKLNYDEDFPSDFVSAYAELKKGGNQESPFESAELARIRSLSGI